jgi:ABC-type phosphate transport system substrate-binding protein
MGLIGCSGSNQIIEPNQYQRSAPVRAELANLLVPNYSGVRIDGSSTVYPISDLAAKEYRKEKGDQAGRSTLNSLEPAVVSESSAPVKLISMMHPVRF